MVFRFRTYAGGYTRTFSPNLINQFRIGYLRTDNSHHGVAAPPAQIADLKMSGLYPLKSTPYVEVGWNNNTGNLALFGGSANNDPNIFDQPTYDMSHAVTINHGRHTITAGIDYRTLKLNDGGGASVGYVLFDGQFSNSHIGDLLLAITSRRRTTLRRHLAPRGNSAFLSTSNIGLPPRLFRTTGRSPSA